MSQPALSPMNSVLKLLDEHGITTSQFVLTLLTKDFSGQTSVWRSSSVRFFSLFGSNRNRNWFIKFLQVLKTGSNRTQPVVCSSTRSKSRFWPTRPWLVVMQLESVRTNFWSMNTYTYYVHTPQVHYNILNRIYKKPKKIVSWREKE